MFVSPMFSFITCLRFVSPSVIYILYLLHVLRVESINMIIRYKNHMFINIIYSCAKRLPKYFI